MGTRGSNMELAVVENYQRTSLKPPPKYRIILALSKQLNISNSSKISKKYWAGSWNLPPYN